MDERQVDPYCDLKGTEEGAGKMVVLKDGCRKRTRGELGRSPITAVTSVEDADWEFEAIFDTGPQPA